MRSLIPHAFFPFPHTPWPRGGLIRSNYFIDSFSGPYHCSFPSIKHMPRWIMRRGSTWCLLRQDHKTASLWCISKSCSLNSPLSLLTFNSMTSMSYSFQLIASLTSHSDMHTGPTGLQVWAQEPHCADGSHSCVEVWGAAGFRDCAVGERWPPPGTSKKSARLSALQHDWKPQQRYIQMWYIGLLWTYSSSVNKLAW